jgi:hypothetical protein
LVVTHAGFTRSPPRPLPLPPTTTMSLDGGTASACPIRRPPPPPSSGARARLGGASFAVARTIPCVFPSQCTYRSSYTFSFSSCPFLLTFLLFSSVSSLAFPLWLA